MHNVHTKFILAVFAAFILGLLTLNPASAKEDAALDRAVMATLTQCQQVSPSCTSMTKNAAGILVFPSVVKADLIIGGAGGKGALIEHGRITGYYNIGAGSAGLQVGVESASQVYVFRTAASLAELKSSSDWKAGATAGVTLVAPDTSANAGSSTGNVLVYVFGAKGLNAGVALDVFDVWKSGQSRPSQS